MGNLTNFTVLDDQAAVIQDRASFCAVREAGDPPNTMTNHHLGFANYNNDKKLYPQLREAHRRMGLHYKTLFQSDPKPNELHKRDRPDGFFIVIYDLDNKPEAGFEPVWPWKD